MRRALNNVNFYFFMEAIERLDEPECCALQTPVRGSCLQVNRAPRRRAGVYVSPTATMEHKEHA